MRLRAVLSGVLLASACLGVQAASAAPTFGIFGDSSNQAQGIAQTGGYTASILSDLSLSSLSGVNVLWVLNGNNGAPTPQLLSNSSSVSNFVQKGGVLIYSDRNVSDAATALPGAATITFVRSLTSNVDVQNAVDPLVSGPGGTISNATLDGGNFSTHGYILGASLPAGGVGILSNGVTDQFVDSYYSFGQGKVYYSTIPIDYYIAGSATPATFSNVYAPNLVAQGASLAGDVAAVPEPASWAMMVCGFGIVGGAMRRRRQQVAFGS